MVHTEVYTGRPFYESFIFIAVVTGALSYLWLKKSHAPRKETMVLAVLLGAVVGFAAYPGALRLNQLTDQQGLQSYDYQMQADYSFIPDRKDLPVLTFPRERNMWSRYPKGYRYAFRLRKGGLGFYQVDLAPVYEKFQQDWYGKKTGSSK
ncbi:MAG: hypothetical protein EHM45_13330 [Desulfobacteraceae bacterium]|nr:MAG: hypothetical protein EHM45_13330 [Desulfobacteraceae bacterium]